MRRGLKWDLRWIAHRTGFIASPSLAFMDVPFGWKKRNLAGEVMAATARSHDAGHCPICFPDAYRSRPAPEDSHQG